MSEFSIRLDGKLLHPLRLAGRGGKSGAYHLAGGSPRRTYLCRFVRAGQVRAQGNQASLLEILPEALEMAVAKGLFDNRAVFVDHSGSASQGGTGTAPSLRNLAGVTLNAAWNALDRSVEGVIRLYKSAAPLAALLDELLAEGHEAPDVGLSIVFWPELAQRTDRKALVWPETKCVVGIRHVESVDLVFEPAADGRVLQALSAGHIRTWSPELGNSKGGALMNDSEEFFDWHAGGSGGDDVEQTVNRTDRFDRLPKDSGQSESKDVGQAVSSSSTVAETISKNETEWIDSLRSLAREALISASGLPEASKQRLMSRSYDSPRQVNEAIQLERQYLGKLAASGVVQVGGTAPRGGHIQVGMDGLERLSLALDALLAGKGPGSGIQPLSGIREAYIQLSGDYDMTGVFYPERISLANVNSSTMAGMVANALNKAVVNAFQQYPRWWEKIVVSEDFSNLQQVKWVTLGGVGELPTVGEGASYTELTWDDQTETASFVKKGGYLGLTLESIDKDDTRRLQAAPRALAQAAWLTLSKTISGIFTESSGVGPTMSDSQALFHANHGNLGSTALSVSSYVAARTAMRKQSELNSGERLGALTAPKYLLVPPDLEITALQVLGSDLDYTYALSNGTAAPANPLAEEGSTRTARMQFARDRVIVVDLWTDTNNWAAVADPLLYPSIGLGFRYGRTPEIFSVASPTAGLMFSNDVMPVKVRFFFAAGPTDWRGLYKANVA